MSYNKTKIRKINKLNTPFSEDFNPFEFLFGNFCKTKACGRCAEAEGCFTTASGECSHAEGCKTLARGKASHAEGIESQAGGDSSHAEGNNTTASGENSHAEGSQTVALGENSHAEGLITIATGIGSHAEGIETQASGDSSHAEGVGSHASGFGSHAEGAQTVASSFDSHAEGNVTTASGANSHAEGNVTTARGESSHAEGNSTTASGANSHAEGNSTTASGENSHAEGFLATASGANSHAEGNVTTASGGDSHAEGSLTTASGGNSHVEGISTTASGRFSHAEGFATRAIGDVSHAEGDTTQASGIASHTQGTQTVAVNDRQMIIGKFNRLSNPANNNTQQDDAFVIGNGNILTRSNAFRVQFNGQVFIALGGSYNVGGADFAEFFEWQDGNPNSVDRIGYFVTLEGEQIKFASSSDFILGVSSATAGLIGNSPDNDDNEKYQTDAFGRLIYEDKLINDSIVVETRKAQLEGLIQQVQSKMDLQNEELKKRLQESIERIGATIIKIKDENSLKELDETLSIQNNEEIKRLEVHRNHLIQQLANVGQQSNASTNIIDKLTKELNELNELKLNTKLGRVPKLNPQYDASQPYIPRNERPEWVPVALLGKVAVRDDGTCQVNGCCQPNDDGIATASQTGYRVLKRVNNEVILILFR